MQHRLKSLTGYKIWAKDGDLGKVQEFYFDDISWTVRYVVVETGDWLSNKKVLLSSAVLGTPDWESKTLSANLTCEQIRNSPDIDTHKPVYRQHEIALHEYYLWPQYWDNPFGGTLGITSYPLLEMREPVVQNQTDDPHLRSTHHVTGYHIHATDGEIGHVEDFIIDDEKWDIRSMVVDTGNWLPGKQVLVSPKWIKSVNWEDSSVYLDRLRESIKDRPDFDPLKSL